LQVLRGSVKAAGFRTPTVMMGFCAKPGPMGLYDPAMDKDACGVGFIADTTKKDTRKTVKDALAMLVRMTHRGACGCEKNTGDGAGICCVRSAKHGPSIGLRYSLGCVWVAGSI
jgi:hypothetical protein